MRGPGIGIGLDYGLSSEEAAGVDIMVGNSLFVDGVFGTALGVRQNMSKPFDTIAHAINAYLTGDIIYVGPGSFTFPILPASSDLVVQCSRQSIIGFGGVDIFADAITPTKIDVTGCRQFSMAGQTMQNADSEFNIQTKKLVFSSFASITQTAGRIRLEAEEATGSNAPVWWVDGQCDMFFGTIAATQEEPEYPIFFANLDITSGNTGDWHIHADKITSSSTVSGTGILRINNSTMNYEAAIWLHCNVMEMDDPISPAAAIEYSGCKLYVTAQKIKGLIRISSGKQFFLITEKLNGTINNFGTVPSVDFYIQRLEDTGVGSNNVVSCGTIGTMTITGMTYICSASELSLGIVATLGTLRLVNCVIDTSANNGTNPLAISGGATVILENCTLVAEGTVNAVEAADAESIQIVGTLKTNRPLNTNITVNGGSIIRTDLPPLQIAPTQVSPINLTAQGAALSGTALFTTPNTADQVYQVSYNASVTRAGTTSTLGGVNGFQLIYTDANDSVVKTTTGGKISAANTTATAFSEGFLIKAKKNTAVTYSFGYTSTGVTGMQYDLSVRVIPLG